MTTRHPPTLAETQALPWVESVTPGPSGQRVAVIVMTPDFEHNRYARDCDIHDLENGTSWRLNAPSASILDVVWLESGALVALRKDGDARTQVWLYPAEGGEGYALTAEEEGVSSFKPFEDGILYLAATPATRVDTAGHYEHVEHEASLTRLKFVAPAAVVAEREARRRGVEAATVAVDVSAAVELDLHPDDIVSSHGKAYLNCRQRADLVYRARTVVAITREDGVWLSSVLPLPPSARVAAARGDDIIVIGQPDESRMYRIDTVWLVAVAALGDTPLDAAGTNLTASLDRCVHQVAFHGDGVLLCYPDGTRGTLDLVTETDLVTHTRHALDTGNLFPRDMRAAGGTIGFIGSSPTSPPEACVLRDGKLQVLTNLSSSAAGLELGSVETVTWESRDGTTIEGVLHKPADYDPSQRYPLLFVVHGGPRGFSTEALVERVDSFYYPTHQFCAAGCLVLKPNYRGSEGRGQAFTELNVDNLGVGDLWDLESAIDHLDAAGLVDPDRVGCMGWSQGGYISAFAGNHSRRFRAVSVGAGISDWYTYHVTNDIPAFTTDYLSVSPFDDRTIYERTAPIAGLSRDSVPHLIQHCDGDRRVPIANAFELYRGLQSMDVPVELFVFKGFGHAVTKPREHRTILGQNFAWFSHHLLGTALDFDAIPDSSDAATSTTATPDSA